MMQRYHNSVSYFHLEYHYNWIASCFGFVKYFVLVLMIAILFSIESQQIDFADNVE